MSVTNLKRIGRLYAVCLGLFGASLVAVLCPTPMERGEAVAHASEFLNAEVESASLSLDGRTWTLQAGQERATLDAQTGELIEIEF